MSKKIRWGILGCGKIANKFAADLKLVADASLVAIGSKDQAKAMAFANQHGVENIFNTYEELAASSLIDIIYVATPHGFHYEHVMICLRHKKAVLCEKALALNLAQVKEMISMARRQKVFFMEAFWTKFLPQYEKITEIIKSGEIGEIKLIQADFGFRAPEPKAQRLYDPTLGGGSLLDIGIYPVFLAQSILGKPVEVNAMITPYNTGVDEQCVMILKFSEGQLAVLSSTFAVDTPVEAMIAGTKGRIKMSNRFHNLTSAIEIVKDKDIVEKIGIKKEEGFGYQYEARHAGDCLRNELTESPVMTHQDSLLLVDTLDRIRKACGIRYEVD